jgi:hypothetical protein
VDVIEIFDLLELKVKEYSRMECFVDGFLLNIHFYIDVDRISLTFHKNLSTPFKH